MRPGRFDQVVLVGAPDAEARKEIFKVHTQKMPTTKIDFELLVASTEGYTGADIESVCREAAYSAMDRESKSVNQSDFGKALEKVRPSINEAESEAYERYREQKNMSRISQPSYA